MPHATQRNPWLMKTIVSGVIGLLLTGFAAWGSRLTNKADDHEVRITRVEVEQKNAEESMKEVKALLHEQSQDTKEILKRLPRR